MVVGENTVHANVRHVIGIQIGPHILPEGQMIFKKT